MLNVTTRMHHGCITDATARILGLIGLHKLVAALHTLSPLRRAHHLRESSSICRAVQRTQEELDLHDYPGGHRHQWGRPAAPEGGTPEGRASGKRNSPSYTHCASRTAAELHHTRIHSLHSKGTAAAQ